MSTELQSKIVEPSLLKQQISLGFNIGDITQYKSQIIQQKVKYLIKQLECIWLQSLVDIKQVYYQPQFYINVHLKFLCFFKNQCVNFFYAIKSQSSRRSDFIFSKEICVMEAQNQDKQHNPKL
ncbi:hypothetical protein pb186bvf_019373 [Paramecium bursaria]